MHLSSYESEDGSIDLGHVPKPVELFLYLLSEVLWKDFRDCTNHEIYKKWCQIEPVSCEDLKIYTAILFHMQINPNHRIKAYWSTDPEKQSLWIRGQMPHDRWLEIH